MNWLLRNKILIKKCLLFLIAGVQFNCFAQQIEKAYVAANNFKCIYHLQFGRIDGSYISYYPNGEKKAEGNFKNNYRLGKWTVWDSLGRKRMVRFYKNPLEFNRVFPPVVTTGPAPLLAQPIYRLQYNKDGYLIYYHWNSGVDIWRNKYWRTIDSTNNNILFTNNRLLHLIITNILFNHLTVYDTIDDRFSTTIDSLTFTKEIDTNHITIVSFKIKEEFIFDINRLVSEYRILGVCPVVNINGKIMDLGWVYYPDMRGFLAKEKIVDTSLPTYVSTLDDLFFYRCFSSTIDKTTCNNPWNLPIKNIIEMNHLPESYIADEQEFAELARIEAENDIWIGLTK
jgi:hypothetical protein